MTRTPKLLYLECVTLSDHTTGPLAICLPLNSNLVDRIRQVAQGMRELGLDQADLKEAMPADHLGDCDVLIANVCVQSDGSFMVWGSDDNGVRTETRWMPLDALEAAFKSDNPIAFGPVQSFASIEDFARELIQSLDEDSEHLSGLEAAYPQTDASEETQAVEAFNKVTLVSMALEISSNDVLTVLNHNVLALANADGKTCEQLAEVYFDQLNFFAIEKAALSGNDLDTQTEYAQEEIANQLREMGVLETPRPSLSEQPVNG